VACFLFFLPTPPSIPYILNVMLQTLELSNFRSYEDGLFGFEPGVNIIVGANASGKTNLLEAIHVICTLQSFKSSDKDLIKLEQEWSRLEAMTDDSVRVVKLQKDKPKIMEIDSVIKKRLSPQTSLPVVVFEPEHMLLLSNEPERRRSYLDGILSMTKPGYKTALLDYRRALSQRNRLLKQEHITADQLFVWDVQLAQRAGAIATARQELVSILNTSCHAHYQSISSSKEALQLTYTSKLSLANYSDQLLQYLRQNVETDMQRGFTGAGPHRDDLLITLKDTDARTTASRGETRTIVLSLKIAELHILHEQTGKKPILLLDDVFSELDGSRRRSLAEALQDYQTFLTTTDADVAVDHFSKYNIIPISKD
jgi:DNA replication and repair protein RecF